MALCFLLLLVLSISNASNYYVSSSTGSDSNTGTSPQSPWKTFKNIATLKLSPGDSLLLLSGDTWNEQLAINNAMGTSNAKITVSLYNPNGNRTSSKRPIINVYNTSYQATEAVLCTNCAGITIQDLEIAGAQFGLAIIYTITNKIVSDITINNCFFHNINGLNYNASSGSWWGVAIATGTTNTNSNIRIENFQITNNMVNETDTFYKVYGGSFPAVIGSGKMYGNTLTNNYYNVMFLGDHMYNFTIEKNVFLYDTPNQEFLYGTTDVIVGTCDSGCRIIDNEFGNRGEYPGGPDGWYLVYFLFYVVCDSVSVSDIFGLMLCDIT